MKLLGMLAVLVLSTAGANHFGTEDPANLEAKSLASAVSSFKADDQDVQAYSGRVGKVCQAKGCWMQLIDGDVMARVKTGHKFFLPKDLTGNAVVYGKLVKIELSAEQAEHFAKESNDGAVAGAEYQILAQSVTMQ
ncbi:hypothetical protein C7S18_07610 [Ahniella affigens]|uniref:DUF4920 domain-containing protein n=1 Tax=Ahniella affigens TaxID=2021234 RepID=A0A2P1PQD9_9GAMM|nr:DUF4920 domain-containing protein [Ahniella affigens]AVP97066.1 hypothetical protein C7S18_07610 [Ahniella affigens]